jgi:hypothetical protein
VSRSAVHADELRRLPHRFPEAKTGARHRSHPGNSQLPVPRPLPAAIKAGHFGTDDAGKPINPAPNEVRAIIEQHAEKIISLLGGRRQMERSFTAPQCSDRARAGASAGLDHPT